MNPVDDDFSADNTDHGFFLLVARGAEYLEAMRKTPEAKKAIQARNDLAQSILEAIEQAETIEDLIHYEVVLQ